MSYILGFDVSLSKTGWAVLDYESGELVDSGTIETSADDSLYERLKFLACSVEDLINSLDTDNFDAALEGGFSARSGTVTRLLAMAWIMVALTIYDMTGIEAEEFPPTMVKKFATGKGNANKDDMLCAAQERWPEIDDYDIADACWVADQARVKMRGFLDE